MSLGAKTPLVALSVLAVCAGVVVSSPAAVGASSAQGQQKSAAVNERVLPDLDVRNTRKVSPENPKAVAELEHSLGAQGFVDVDPATGGVAFVGRTDGFLTGKSNEAPAGVARGYANDHRAALGLGAADIAALDVSNSYTSVDGVTHVTFAQSVARIDAYDSYLRANVDKAGRLINLSGAPVSGLSLRTTKPDLSAAQALAAARKNVGGDLDLPKVESSGKGPEQATSWKTYGEAARLTIFAGSSADRLAWRVSVQNADSVLYEVVVDAATGEVLARTSLTSFESNDAQVWEDHPDQTQAPLTVDLGADPAWLDRSAANGDQLMGNNAHVYTDLRFSANGYQAGEETVRSGSGDWVFPRTWFNQAGCPAFGCTWNSADNATLQANRDATVTQFFYLVNNFHDYLLAPPIGFDEASGNFEQVNSSGQGLGGDALLAEVDLNGRNNANMSTPADGSPPRMQAYPATSPHSVISADAADTIYHEYTHGLVARLVARGGVWGAQAGAMSEGWADWYALDYLVGEGIRADEPASGGVLFGGYEAPGGWRTEAIDCPVGAAAATCPGSGTAGPGGYTYGDLGKIWPTGFEYHSDGEIWAQTLWDLRAAVGRQNTLKLVTGGLRLGPQAPNMLDSRDAILQAALIHGVNTDDVWAVFANRGMGFNASTDGDQVVSEDFTLPPPLVHVRTDISDTAPGGDGDTFPEPGETLTVSVTMENPSAHDIAPFSGTVTTEIAGAVGTLTATWPAIPAGGQAVNDSPLTVVIANSTACGSHLTLSGSAAGPDGPVAIPEQRLEIGARVFTDSLDVPVIIPDGDPAVVYPDRASTAVSSNLTVPGTGPVTSLKVRIDRLEHHYIGDLTITLTHGAKTVVLMDRAGPGDFGSSGQDLVDLVFDDEASTPIESIPDASPPGGYTGRYTPNEPLSAFNGDSKEGTWTLTILDPYWDGAPGLSGTLKAWSLSPGPECAQPYSFTGFAAPVDMNVVNKARAGQTVPFKFTVTDSNGVPVTNLTGVNTSVVAYTCESGVPLDAIEEYATGGSGLQNFGDGTYQYNFKTKKGWAGSCRTLGLDLGDGVVHTADFQFK